MRQRRFSWLLASAVAVLLAGSAYGKVRVPTVFSDNMVLQQGLRAPVWGWADEGEKITVTFRGHSVETKTRNGKWRVNLPRLTVGGPDMLVIKGNDGSVQIQNVLVGEVWICSGQSNMEWPMSKAYESAAAIAGSANPMIRLCVVPNRKSESPQTDDDVHWTQAGPGTIASFSAVAYYFGRDLQSALGRPIGLIQCDWGGSPAEAWTSQEVLVNNPDYKRDILDNYETQLAAFQKSKAANRRAPWKPAELYNGMLAPLIPYGIKGAIWYQGEANASRAFQYRSLFLDMIRDWRDRWDQGDFPFLAVQLASYDKNRKRTLEAIQESPGPSDWAELREAQVWASQKLRNVGVAVTTDVGEKDDIHPTRKEPVGARLALAARAIAYGENIEYSGPRYRKLKVKSGQARVFFDHATALEAKGGKLTGFEICGEDGKFVWADANISGSTVVITSPAVPHPVAVRYGWSDFPVVNLYNSEGLPASPFRTDDFPLTTRKKEAK